MFATLWILGHAGPRAIIKVMQDTGGHHPWLALNKDDDGLLGEIFELLKEHAKGDPYGADGSFAASIARLPAGLRAMAATHWLDISLTLDSITWHFGNFGEPGLTATTEAGLRELGLHDLAACFREARDLMIPLLADRPESDGSPIEILERHGLGTRGAELDQRAWDLDKAGAPSLIYGTWVRYARQHPERVFELR